MAIRCPGCGKFLSANDKKCPNCGTVLGSNAKPVAPVKSAPVKAAPEEVVTPAPEVLRRPVMVTRYREVEVQLDPDFSGKSYFDGRFIQFLGWFLLGWLVTVVTIGICFPLAYGWLARWEARHTVICGYRETWNGACGSLIPKWLLWCLLTIITLTIFAWWNPIRFRKWKVARIKLVKDPKSK